MRTVKYFYFAWLALVGVALGAVSCAKTLGPEEKLPPGEGKIVPIAFNAHELSGASTKVAGVTEAQEKAIVRWAVFAFDNEYGWVSSGSVEGNGSIQIELREKRSYTLYAVANYPTSGAGAIIPGSVKKASDITAKVSSLSDNAVGSLVMYGTESFTTAPITYSDPEHMNPIPQSKSISVRRLVARLDVRKMSVDFSEHPYLASKTFVLKHIYVTNAYRSSRMGSDYSVSELSSNRTAWYNTMGWHGAESPESAMDALLGVRDINAAVTPTSPYSVAQSFYVYPNATPKSQDVHQTASWTRRCTRMVIEATWDGETDYYIINVPAVERNRIYALDNLVIKGRGSKDPENFDPWPEAIDVSFIVAEEEWTDPLINVTELS